MDLSALFGNTIANSVFVTAIGGAIVTLIQGLKMGLEKTSWGSKIPSWVWVGLSMAMGIGFAMFVNYNMIAEVSKTPDGTQLLSLPPMLTQGSFGSALSGILIAVDSKIVHAIATPMGAKAAEIKANIQNRMSSSAPLEVPEFVQNTVNMSTPVVTPPVMTDDEERVLLVKQVEPQADFVLIGTQHYKVTKGENING